MDDTPTTLVVAERDDAQREFLVDQFLADGFLARGARCAEEARVKLAHSNTELLALGGLEALHAHLALLRELRSRALHDLLAVVLGPADSEPAELRAFEAGGDDYLRRPISYPVLLARVRALLRRLRGAPVPRRRIGALEIDALARGHRRGATAAALAAGVRAARAWPPSPPGCGPRRSCCARCGATSRWARPARSTPTPAGCAGSSPWLERRT